MKAREAVSAKQVRKELLPNQSLGLLQTLHLVTRDGRRVFELGLGPATLAFVGASRPEDHTLIDRVLNEVGSANFAAAWLEARGLREAANAVRRFNAQTQNRKSPAVFVAAE